MDNTEIITLLKKQLFFQRITTILLFVLIVGLIIVGVIITPKILDLYQKIVELVDQLQPTIEGLNNFDYTTLNSTLSDLKTAIDSLNGVMSIFH